MRSLVAVLLVAGLLPVVAAPGAEAEPTSCSATATPTASELERLTTRIAGFGPRYPGSAAHRRMVGWVADEVRGIDGVTVRTSSRQVTRWLPDGDLARAGTLTRDGEDIATAGAIPDTRPGTRTGRLTYLPADQAITRANARGRVVVRDMTWTSVPNAALDWVAYYRSPDFESGGTYSRPYNAKALHADLVAASEAGAAGVVVAWDVPTRQIRGYYDPHRGTPYRMPGVWVGGDDADWLKLHALNGDRVRIGVAAERDRGTTRDVVATLPGQTDERVVLVTHTDGNTWVQENGAAGLIATARHLAALPLECRTRTYEFVFTSGHLRMSQESTPALADQLSADFDDGTLAYVWAIEHLGARRIEPVDGRLVVTDEPEDYAWFAGVESPALSAALVESVTAVGARRTVVLKGMEAPVAGRSPAYCSFGGIGSLFQRSLVPTLAGIAGPWSLWAPSFGRRALDFGLMRDQVRVVVDTLAALDGVASVEIAGSYPEERASVAAGAPTCDRR